MARSLSSQILTRTSILAAKSPPHASRLLTLRNESSNPQTLVDPFDSDTTSESTLALEDAIHRIVVRRSAPGWLPFRPGSSYWVPPRTRSYGIADLMDNLSNSLTQEELMSLTTFRGWPSSAFYVNDASQGSVGAETTSKDMPQSEEEEE